MYYTGIDPFTKQKVYVARNLHDRKLQRALMQFFKPENYFEVSKALEQAGRKDLIGSGCDALIPAEPPKAAVVARRERANRNFRGDYVLTIPNNSAGSGPRAPKVKGYGPGPRTARRRPRQER
jgi:hypothetical protein